MKVSEANSVAIMITTHNRLSDLKRTCLAVSRLLPQPDEILITFDGCTDGSREMVSRLLPEARTFVNQPGKGSVASRHRMLLESRCDLVLSLDDDSYPEENGCVRTLKRVFEGNLRLAVAHFAQRTDENPKSLTKTDFGPSLLTGSYANSGACYRRSVYVSLPGFPVDFFHAYEEPDYALQCVAAGFDVLFSPKLVIRHHYSLNQRSEPLVHRRHARNELWSVLLRCPFPHLVPVAMYRIISQARYAGSRGVSWLWKEPVWWWASLRGMPRILRQRQAIPWPAYRQWLSVLRHPSPVKMKAGDREKSE